jgi:hypothetical protein
VVRNHCGVQLQRLTPDREAYILKQTTWMCAKCGKRFTQRLRSAKGQKTIEQRKHIVEIYEIRKSQVVW